jgi:hypothetical protein
VKAVYLTLAVLTGLSAAPAADAPRTFNGVITDDMCARGGHATMRMGPTDAECTRACVNIHGAAYVLFDGKNVYALSDQQSPDRFAGQSVRVTGVLDSKTKTIRVQNIAARPSGR